MDRHDSEFADLGFDQRQSWNPGDLVFKGKIDMELFERTGEVQDVGPPLIEPAGPSDDIDT